MDFNKAINLKKEIAASALSKKQKTRTISFAAGGSAIALRAEADLQTVVNGVGIGEKQDGENIIRILTREESSFNAMALSRYYGVKQDEVVIERVGGIQFKNSLARHRPPFPGISVGHYRITAGTLGCFVADQKDKVYILSNNHVLADSDKGKWMDPVLQPGKLDGGSRRKDIIAFLSYLVPLSRTTANTMDAAIALVDENEQPDFRIFKKGSVKGSLEPANKLKVEKWGRTTGHTTGTITTRNLDIQVDFESETLEFQDQFEVKGNRGKMFCDGGDSGSLILERGTFRAVGLLFAGNDEGITYASPIRDVLTAFSVRIL